MPRASVATAIRLLGRKLPEPTPTRMRLGSCPVIPGVLDREVRCYVYDATIASGRPPTPHQIADALGVALDQVRAAFERLAESRQLVLQRDTREILMAMPFSA